MIGTTTIPGAIGYGAAPVVGTVAPIGGYGVAEVDKVNAFGQVVERDFYGTATVGAGRVVGVQETIVPEKVMTTAEKWVEVPEMVVKKIQQVEKLVEVPRIMTQEIVRNVPVPQIQTVEKLVEVPQVQTY